MKTLNGLMLTLVATFTLAGCGGGGDGGTENGGTNGGISGGWGALAVAYDRTNGTPPVFITNNFSSKNLAEAEAMKICGVKCTIVLNIEPGRCGAIYYSQTQFSLQDMQNFVGYDVANTKEIANTVAKDACEQKSKKTCIGISGCNT